MSKKRKKVKSSSSKRKNKNNIRIISDKELSTIDKLGIDLAAGLSNEEVSKIEKQGINIRKNNAKIDLRKFDLRADAAKQKDMFSRIYIDNIL